MKFNVKVLQNSINKEKCLSLSKTVESPNLPAIEKQPKALYVLFFTEIWERFSIYGMKALLVLYMTKELAFNNSHSYGILGAYFSLLYASNILGGYLADSFLGNRQAVFIGSFFIILGHLTLSLPLDFENAPFFYGLAFLIVGTGFFKPNVSSFLGQFYHKNDARRDGGFTIFYMGINVGGLLGPLLCGTIGEVYGWHYGFGIAAIGMVAGAFIFYRGEKHFGDKGLPPFPKELNRPIIWGLSLRSSIILGAFLFVPLIVYIIQHHEYMGGFFSIAGPIVLAFISFIAFRSPPEERKCILTLAVMFVFYGCFLVVVDQSFGSLLLFTEHNVDRNAFGTTIPTTWFLSLNPIFIIAFGPFIAGLWLKLGQYKLEPSTPWKFAYGFILLALGSYLFLIGIDNHADGYVNLWWLVAGTAVMTLSELFIAPVSLSMITRLSPAKFTSLLMGAYFFASGFAEFIAQNIAQAMGTPDDIDPKVDIMTSLAGFENILTFVTQLAVITAIAAFIVIPIVRGVFKRHA